MPKGMYPTPYFLDPSVGKSSETSYSDLDAYTMEYFEDEPAFHERIDLWVLLPPLLYEGHFLKGICFSQGVDFLHKLYPQLPQLFFSIANSQWCSYPWSRCADAYFSLYPNASREAWFRRTNPDRAGKILIPLQDADFTNEYTMAPVPFVPKEYDVICVSRMHDLKHLPMIAAALKVYRQKYRPIRMVLIVGKAFDVNFKGLTAGELTELRKIEAILQHPRDYLEFVPQARYGDEFFLPSAAKRGGLPPSPTVLGNGRPQELLPALRGQFSLRRNGPARLRPRAARRQPLAGFGGPSQRPVVSGLRSFYTKRVAECHGQGAWRRSANTRGAVSRLATDVFQFATRGATIAQVYFR